MAMLRNLETLNKNIDERVARKSIIIEEAAEIRKTLNGFYKSKDKEDLTNQKGLELDLNDWKDKSSKGIIENLMKKQMNSSSQLADNITKFEYALAIKERELAKVGAEIMELQREAKTVSANRNAQAAADEIDTFLTKYKELQTYFENQFKSVINQANMSDPKWPARLKDLGFRPAYEVTGVSFLKPSKLISLSIQTLVERIQNLRNYGEPLLAQKDRNVQPARDNYDSYDI